MVNMNPRTNPAHHSTSTNTNLKKGGSEFLTKLKWMNTLPNVPVDAKLVPFPLSSHRYIPYSLTSLEKHHTFDIPLSLRSIAEINLIDMSIYPGNEHLSSAKPTSSGPPLLAPEDEELARLPLPTSALTDLQDRANSMSLNEDGSLASNPPTPASLRRPNVSWLRKSEHGLSEASRLKGHHSASRPHREEYASQPMTLEKAIQLLDTTFAMASTGALSKLRHPLHPSLSVTKILPIVPDPRELSPSFALCMFDSAPHSYTDRMTHLNGRIGPVRGFLKGVTMSGGSGTSSDHFLLYYANSKKSELEQPHLLSPAIRPKNNLVLSEDESENENAQKQRAFELEMKNRDLQPMEEMIVPYLRDYEYQTKKEAEAQNHVLILGQKEVYYHPIYTKLVLRVKRNTKLAERSTKPTALKVRPAKQIEEENELSTS